MPYLTLASCLKNEKRFHGKKSLSLLFRYMEIIAAVLIFKRNIPPLAFSPEKYTQSMKSHSDYRKFDDMLRMIIDCDLAQVNQVKTYLDQAHQRGDLCYGLHQSETSVMTCYVNSLGEGDHIHFIDSGNGGYAMAAKQLKSQQRALASSS